MRVKAGQRHEHVKGYVKIHVSGSKLTRREHNP